MRFSNTSLAQVVMVVVAFAWGCGSTVEDPGKAGSTTTSSEDTNQTGTTSTSTGSGGTGSTGSGSVGQGGSCPDGPPDPMCGCVGWEVYQSCSCDCGGTTEVWNGFHAGCEDMPTELACPNGFGGDGGAPSTIDCAPLGTTKVCGP